MKKAIYTITFINLIDDDFDFETMDTKEKLQEWFNKDGRLKRDVFAEELIVEKLEILDVDEN